MKLKSLISTVALVAGMSAMAPSAQAADWSLSADYTSNYVFRGISFGADSIQVGAEVALGDFYAGVWTSSGFGETSVLNGDEIDFYAGYGFALSETVSADIGATLYHFPQAGDVFDIGADEAGTVEVYGGLGFDTAFEPSLYAYYDTSFEAFTLEGSAGHSIPVAENASFDLSGSLGSVFVDDADYQYLTVGAAYSYAFNDSASGYVGINGSVASEDNFPDWEGATAFLLDGTTTVDAPESSAIWYGAGLSASF